MPYRTLEVHLDSLFIHENGAVSDAAAANLLTSRLIYPRPGIQTVTTVKSLALDDGDERDFSTSSFTDRILFKERIQGVTEILVELSVQLPGARIPALAEALLSGATGAGLAVLGGGMGTPLLTAAASRGAREITRSGLDTEAREEPAAIIGEGRTELSAEALAAEGEVVRNVELRVPEGLILRKTRAELEPVPRLSGPYHDHYRATREEIRLDTGQVAGWINLRLAVI